MTTWCGPNGQLSNTTSITLSNVYATASSNEYQSTLTISGFEPGIHNGNYSCNSTILSSSPYLTGNSASVSKTIIVSGITLILQKCNSEIQIKYLYGF